MNKQILLADIETLKREIKEIQDNDLFSLLNRAEELSSRADEILDEESSAAANTCKAWCALRLMQFESALSNFKKSAQYFKNTNRKAYLENLIGEASVYQESGMCQRAIDYYKEVKEEAQKDRYDEELVEALTKLGEVDLILKQWAPAFDNFLNALEIAEKGNFKLQISKLLLNLGKVYLNRNDLETAILHFQRVLEMKINANMAEANLYLAIALNSIGKAEEAGPYFRDSIALSKEQKQSLIFMDCSLAYSEYKLARGEESEAIKLLENAAMEGALAEQLEGVSRVYQALYQTFKVKKEFEKALHFHEKLLEIEQKQFNSRTSMQIGILSTEGKVRESREENRILMANAGQMQEAFNRLAAISQIGQEITSSLNLETIITTMYDRVNQITSADIFGIAVYSKEKEEIDYKLFIRDGKKLQLESRSLYSDNSLAAYCIRNDTNIFINDKDTDLEEYNNEAKFLLGNEIESIIYVPLRIQDKIIGVTTVQSKKKNAYTHRDIESLTILGSYLAIALDNSAAHSSVNHLNELLRKEKNHLESVNTKIKFMADHDPLTGLPNRKLFHELFAHIFSLCRREKSKMAVFYMDLDRFKPINDRYGHKSGDMVLQIVARRFIKNLRKEDIVSRIGGDEFIAVIIGREDMYESVAGKIIEEIGKPIKLEPEGVTVTVGVSIGIARFPQNGKNAEALISEADQAMYQAKNKGRNTFHFSKAKAK